MAMVNMNNLLNGKDSRWLQLEVCREFQRNKCSRPDTECKFAHPPANVEVQNGRVTACYDSIKGRCNRDKPPCKYFHPPQHLKDQLLINGRNHLALKNALMQQMGLAPGGQALVPAPPSAAAAAAAAAAAVAVGNQIATSHPAAPFTTLNLMAANTPYLTSMPAQVGGTFSPYFSAAGPLVPLVTPTDPSAQLSMAVQQTVVTQQKIPRTDRLENPMGAVGPTAAALAALQRKRAREAADDLNLLMDMKSVGSIYYDNFGFPGMVPYKRAAGGQTGTTTGATTDKTAGMAAVYQPHSYQQLLQPFVPVTCEYRASPYAGIALNKMKPPPCPSFLPPPPGAAQVRPAYHHPAPPPPYAPTASAAPTVVNNNNLDDFQPYKKMKTT